MVIYLPQILFAILMLIAVWFGKNCHAPMRETTTVVYFLIVLIPLIGLHYQKKDKLMQTRVVLIISVISVFIVAGYLYLFIAMILNHKKSPKCTPVWAIVLEWISLGYTFFLTILPIIFWFQYIISEATAWRKLD